MPSYSSRSSAKLDTCDKRLQDVFNTVIKHHDCTIIYGYRNKELQDRLHAENPEGASKWPDSNHNTSPSRAVDVMPYHADAPHIRWEDIEGLREFAIFVKGVAAGMGIRIRWGGDFKRIFDGAHWELED